MTDEVAVAACTKDVESSDAEPGLSETGDDGAGLEAFTTDLLVG